MHASQLDAFPKRAARLFPGSSNGEYGIPPDLAPVLTSGRGCRVRDTEGRSFLDMTMAWGAALVGHAHPKVIEAAKQAADGGGNFAAVTDTLVRLAERMAEICPCVERVRFVASGTEATMLCLRVARAATGRRLALKFEGAYHGQHPEGVAAMLGRRLDAFPQCDGFGAGAPWVERDLLVAPYNDLETTRRIIASAGDELAAVIVEPLHRCIAPSPGFLQGLREATRERGVVLIFDEVVTGFRLALGGAQEHFGVTPDLAAYGKALGGGFPIGAFGGCAELMDVMNELRIDAENYLWSASTGGGNPVSAAAALAAIDAFSERGVYDRLRAMGEFLRERIARAFAEAGEAGQALGAGPLAQAAFGAAAPIRDQRSWLASDRARGRRVMLELLRRGVFLNPMGTKLYVSLAHDDLALEEFGERFSEALAAA